MLRVSDPRRMARARLLALTCQVPMALVGEVEGVHQARVASRRLREFLPLLAIDDGSRKRGQRLRKQARRLTRGLGPVRDLDVSALRLEAIVAAGGPQADAARLVRDALGIARADAFRAMQTAIEAVPLDRLRRAVSDAAASAAPADARQRVAAVLGERLERRGRGVADALTAAGMFYAPDRLHRARVAVKKFRYALELALELGRFRLRGSLTRLKRLQDVLGDLHDDEVLAARTRDVAAACRSDERSAVEALAEDLDGVVRQRHSAFLRERESLPTVFRWTRRVASALKGQES